MTTKISNTEVPYTRRQIVARLGVVGFYSMNNKNHPIPQYITFHLGEGQQPLVAIFDRQADTDDSGFIDLNRIKEGELVIAPGLIYRKTCFTGNLMTAHLQALKKFRPRSTVAYEKDHSAPPVNLGSIDFTGVTKQ